MGKTELLIHFVAWALSHYPDSNFLYVSYSLGLAKKQTKTIRQIIAMEEYRSIFNIMISDEASAQGNFETSSGGSVFAAGADGEITGRGAGIKGTNRFGGCIVIDDIHKPSEVTSDAMRASVNDWYFNTLQSRVNEPDKTPIIFIGQRLHEDDLAANLIKSDEWETVIIPALDKTGNPLHPGMHNREALARMQETMPYVFASQYQQDPMPAGGGIFKPEWFYLTEEEPEIITTFITADTAETDKSYNDATVFSFFGLYKIKQHGVETDLVGLHWLDCVEIRIEPKDLENAFLSFYSGCMRYKVKPRVVAIEKKSTGVTLLSVLKNVRGLQPLDVERTRASGNKTTRFLEIQPFIASRQVSLPKEGKHTQHVLEHMRKITANDSHRHDDVCFVAGTKIATMLGNKNIEQISVGEFIITPFGLKRVINCGSTGQAKIIHRMDLIGTANHKVFYGDRYERLDTVNDDSKINNLSFKGLLEWKYKRLLYSMESSIDLWDRDAIISVNQQKVLEEKIQKDFMSQSMNFIAARKFKKAISFITKMAIILITTSATWSVYRLSNMLKCIRKKEEIGNAQKKNFSIWKRLGNWLPSGIEVKTEENGIVKTLKNAFRKYSLIENLFVSSVINSSLQDVQKQSIAEIPVEQESIDGLREVFNLTVESVGVYYANGILVSNCDTLYDAVKLGIIDNVIMSYNPQRVQDDDRVARNIMGSFTKLLQLRGQRYGNRT